ncbi:MAG: CARDB domain-containing protein [Isosphaeraceae bacterium]
MSSHDRRSAGRRRAWGRGPIILKFEPLEGRELLSAATLTLPDLVGSSFVTTTNADWGQPITASGVVTNQGSATVTTPFNVGIYASHNVKIGPTSVLLGEVTLPAGLAPGQSVPFSTTVKLPSSPLSGMSYNGEVHINLKIDPERVVPESNYHNQSGLGPGYDESAVQITPAQPANLVMKSMGIISTNPVWGGSLTVTAQIANQGYGDAPATQAEVVLTPAGVAQGGSSDVVIGTIAVPPIPAWMQVNVDQTIKLPATPPVLLAGQSAFTLSILPDDGYITNAVYPHFATGGVGVDQSPVGIVVANGTTLPTLGNLPDLAVGAVKTSSTLLHWGQNVQVTAGIVNQGAADSGPFRVDFVLVGASGNLSHGIFLGQTTVANLAAGGGENLTQTFQLPVRLPAGVLISSVGTGKIAVVVDPGHTVNESFYNNNEATSGPVVLRLLGSDGTTTVPTYPYPAQLLTVQAPVIPVKAITPVVVHRRGGITRFYRRPPSKPNSIIHELSIFPKQVNSLIKKYV